MRIITHLKRLFVFAGFGAALFGQPVLVSVDPNSSYPPCGPFDISIVGSGFQTNAVVILEDAASTRHVLAITALASTEIQATVLSSQLETPGMATLTVEIDVAGVGVLVSNPLSFLIGATPFNSISPQFVFAGSGDTVVTVSGGCFENGATVMWQDQPLATTFVNASTLQATIPAAFLTNPGSVEVRVRNANGNESNAIDFFIDIPAPTVTSVSPSASYPPCAPFEITVAGQFFEFYDSVIFNGQYLSTTYVDSTELTATVTSDLLGVPGPASVYVERPEAVDSNTVSFEIRQTPIDSVSPDSATVGSEDTLLTVTGSCYEAGAAILWNGSPLQTTFVNATTLQATIPESELISAGNAEVSVFNANENTSATLPFSIGEPPPSLSSVSPTSSYPPCAPFDITLSGEHLNSGAEVFFNGSPLATTFISDTELSAALTSNDLSVPGQASIFVRQPSQPDSNTLSFQVNATPLSSISPDNVFAGAPDTVLTVTGACFESGAEILWDGSPLPTTFISSTTLQATIPASNLALPDVADVSVRNANGNASEARYFGIEPPLPSISSVSPTASYPPCAAFTLTVTGQNFDFYDEIVLGGSYLPTTWESETELRATVTSNHLSSPGDTTIYVERPEVDVSSSLPFLVRPTPFTAMTPQAVPPGSEATLLAVAGDCFEQGAEILWNGQPLQTSFVSATTLEAFLPADELVAPGTAEVRVRNANGNTSAARTFTINDPAPPVPETVVPPSGPLPCPPFEISVDGRDLPFDGQVVLGGVPLATMPGNGAELIAIVTSEALATPGPSELVVRQSNLGDSAPLPFLIRPTPVSGLTPASAGVDSGPVALRVDGSCFEPGATVLWNGEELVTMFIDSTRLDAIVPAPMLVTAGFASVNVRNANGNTSVRFPFQIGEPEPVPPPTISSIAPSIIAAGSDALRVNVNGSDLDPQAIILVDGVPAPFSDTLWFNSNRILVTIPARSLIVGGVIPIEAENPDGKRAGPVDFRVQPVISDLNPRTWAIGRPCELIISGRGFSGASVVVLDGPAGRRQLPADLVSGSTEIRVCLPTELVATAGPAQVSVCNGEGSRQVCSAPTALEITGGISITSLRPMSAPAGSPTLCLAVDIEARLEGSAPLSVRWDGADLPSGATQCPATAGLRPEAREIAQGLFATTVLAEVDSSLLAAQRPRTASLPCQADPTSPKVTAFDRGSNAESAPVCFDIAALNPTIDPPRITPGPGGCLEVTLVGENIHRDAEILVDGLADGFCEGGNPTVGGCGLGGRGPSICTEVTFLVPPGSGVVGIAVRNPEPVCTGCPPQTFTVNLDEADAELPPHELSLSCADEAVAFPRTPVGSQSVLRCALRNESERTGRVGELTMVEPFSVEASGCSGTLLPPDGDCPLELAFSANRAGLFGSELTITGPDGGGSLGRYLAVATLRSARLSVVGSDSLPPAEQSAIRIEAEGGDGAAVRAVLRQSLRLDPGITVFPAGPGVPAFDCGFATAVAGVAYSQPLVAACDTADAAWELEALDGGSWASLSGDTISGAPAEAGVYTFNLLLSPGFPGSSATVSQTCSLTVVDDPAQAGGGSGDGLLPCASAQFETGGARREVDLGGAEPVDVGFQTGGVAGTLRFLAGFEADGVDVSPDLAPATASATVALQAPLLQSATFSCPSSSELLVEVAGYSSTREVSGLLFAFQPAPGSAGPLELTGDAATRPDLVQAYQTRFASGSGAGALDGGFLMQARFSVSGRAADIGGVSLTMQNSVGSASITAVGGQPACGAVQ